MGLLSSGSRCGTVWKLTPLSLLYWRKALFFGSNATVYIRKSCHLSKFNRLIYRLGYGFLFDIALPITMSVSFTVQYVRGKRAVNATENSLAKPYTNSITASIYVRTYTLGHFHHLYY